MHIAIGCDHRGLDLKQSVIKLIAGVGHGYEDFGCYSNDPVDYPDIAGKVTEAVVTGDFNCGILICGAGVGMSIAANKVRGIRLALCHNTFTAFRARRHNDANILCLAAEGEKESIPEIIKTFLTTDFEGGRHQRRLDKISDMENQR